MKKILPIISILGISGALVGCSNTMEVSNPNIKENVDLFNTEVQNYAEVNTKKINTTTMNKYNISLATSLDEDLTQDIESQITTLEEIHADDSNDIITEESSIENDDTVNDEYTEIKSTEDTATTKNENISTLYALSADIEDSCDEFCELKEEVTDAILETQNLINKIQSNEIELTGEQRMFITEQSMQLKYLAKELANATTELSIQLSDLNQIMKANNQDIDSISLKYLIILDNLMNGNEMLQNGLNNLNLMNQTFGMNERIAPNNRGRILYGFRQNDEPPIIKDYIIDENGEIIENQPQESEQNPELEVINENKNNIDTYSNTNLNTNLDTYRNNNLPRNIDSFFNTALLDNEFMYGNGGYGYGLGYGANPYMSQYSNYEQNNEQNATNSVEINQNTQDNQQAENKTHDEQKQEKRFKLTKNIDTYRDENTPDLKVRFQNIKNNITGFFNKFKKGGIEDKIQRPVYKYDEEKSQG
ncbi:MAG: hypothetical protein E7351_02115 [Clostridiales bacterium]|nr:hypothetical protein [Clostridiales bacterium]